MSSAALPPNPNLEQLKKQAKSLLKGHRSADPASAQRLRQTLSHLSEQTDDEIFQTKFSLRNAPTGHCPRVWLRAMGRFEAARRVSPCDGDYVYIYLNG